MNKEQTNHTQLLSILMPVYGDRNNLTLYAFWDSGREML